MVLAMQLIVIVRASGALLARLTVKANTALAIRGRTLLVLVLLILLMARSTPILELLPALIIHVRRLVDLLVGMVHLRCHVVSLRGAFRRALFLSMSVPVIHLDLEHAASFLVVTIGAPHTALSHHRVLLRVRSLQTWVLPVGCVERIA